VVTAARAVLVSRLKEQSNGRHQPDPDSPSVPSPSQDLPVLRRQRTEDRRQGRASAAALHCRARQDRSFAYDARTPQTAARTDARASAAALHFRARQDRSFAYHGCQPEEAARTRQGDQARPFPRPAALRREVRLTPGRLAAPEFAFAVGATAKHSKSELG